MKKLTEIKPTKKVLFLLNQVVEITKEKPNELLIRLLEVEALKATSKETYFKG